MKAVFKTKNGPGIEVIDTDIPKVGENDFLMKVMVASICGTDVHLYQWHENKEGPNWWDQTLKLPVILGHEFSGQVVEVGSRVKKVKVGDRIIASCLMSCGECDMCQGGKPDFCMKAIVGLNVNGAMAEYLLLNSTATVYKLPDHVSYESASLIEPLCVALHGVEISGIKPGDTAAVMGPGPIGLLTLELLKASGASKVIMVGASGDRKRLDLAAKLGATRVINAETEDVTKAVMDLTNGEGLDLVFEASGNAAAFAQTFGMARAFGKIVALGMYTDTVRIDPNQVVIGNKCVMGSMAYDTHTWTHALAMVAGGVVHPEAIIGGSFSFADGQAAFDLAATRDVAKVVLTP